jgi:hypothetical protein
MIQTIGMNYIAIPEALSAGLPIWNVASNYKARRMMNSICEERRLGSSDDYDG